MASTITYNGLVLDQIGKVQFSFSDPVLRITFSFYANAAYISTNQAALRTENAALVIAAGSWTQTFSIGTNATAIRPSFDKTGHGGDSNNLKIYSMVIEVNLATTWSDGFADWTATVDEDERGYLVMTINGRVTGNTSGSGAVARFNAGIGAIVTTVEALFDTVDWELPAVTLIPNRTNRDLNFTYRKQQRMEDDNVSGTYDPTIVIARWDVQETYSTVRGNEDFQFNFRVNWEAKFPISKTDYTTQWEGTLRQMISDKFKSTFPDATGKQIVMLEDSFDFSPTQRNARGSFSASVATDTVSYLETVTQDIAVSDFVKRMTGNDFDGVLYTAGASGIVRQEVRWRRRGQLPTAPSKPAIRRVGSIAVGLGLKSVRPSNLQQFVGRAQSGVVQVTEYQMDWTAEWWIVSAAPSTSTPNIAIEGQTQSGSAFKTGGAQSGGTTT